MFGVLGWSIARLVWFYRLRAVFAPQAFCSRRNVELVSCPYPSRSWGLDWIHHRVRLKGYGFRQKGLTKRKLAETQLGLASSHIRFRHGFHILKLN